MFKNIILLLILLYSIIPVDAIVVAKTSPQYDSYVNMTNNSNNIYNQIILIIPKEALNNTNEITALQFLCSKNFSYEPNNNLVFRFYKYYGLSVFSLIDNTYIIPSQCIDSAGYQITWNLFNVENVDHNYDYAFGIYSNSVTSGSWQYLYKSEYGNLSNPESYSWLNISNNNPIINVSIVDLGGSDFIDNGSRLINYPLFNVLGTLEISPTPTPTAAPTSTIPAPTNNSLGKNLTNGTNLNDLSNITNNPDGIYEIAVGSDETVGTIVDKINGAALGFTVFGFLIFIIRFFSIKKDVN